MSIRPALPPPRNPTRSKGKGPRTSEWHLGEDLANWVQEQRTCFLLPLMEIDYKERTHIPNKWGNNWEIFNQENGALDPEMSRLSKFSQMEYLTFLNWLNKVIGAGRLDRIRAGKSLIPGELVADHKIEEQMFEMYGKMDKSSPLYPKLLANFKESYREAMKDCEDSEATAMKLDPSLKSFDTCLSVHEKFRKVMSYKEQVFYKHVDPSLGLSEADYLQLPRPWKELGEEFMNMRMYKLLRLKLIQESENSRRQGQQGRGEDMDVDSDEELDEVCIGELPVSKSNDEAKDYEKFGSMYTSVFEYFDRFYREPIFIGDGHASGVDLARFDPRYFDFPRHVSNSIRRFDGLEYVDSGDYIPRMVAYKLNELIHNYPSGISAGTLLMIYHRDYGYPLKLPGEETDYDKVLENLLDIFYVLPYRGSNGGAPLLFPKAFEELIATREIISMRITHFIIMAVMLEKTGFVKVKDILGLIWKHFGIRIVFSEWGYPSILHFVKDFISPIADYANIVTFWHMRPNYEELADKNLHIRSYEETFLVFKMYTYATENFTSFRRDNEDIGVRDYVEYLENAAKSVVVSHKFLSAVESLPTVSELMVAGRVLDCTSLFVDTPALFAVTPTWDMNKLDSFRSVLRQGVWLTKCAQPPNLDQLIALNLPVLVRVPSTQTGVEWCRGIVVRVEHVKEGVTSVLRVKVRLLDYGKEVNVTDLNDISLMPKGLGKNIRTAAVYCKLLFNDPDLNRKQDSGNWNRDDINIFLDLTRNTKLRIRLHCSRLVHLFRIIKPQGVCSNMPEKRQGKVVVEGIEYSAQGDFHLPLQDYRLWTVSASAVNSRQGPTVIGSDEVVIPDIAAEFERRYHEMQNDKEDKGVGAWLRKNSGIKSFKGNNG